MANLMQFVKLSEPSWTPCQKSATYRAAVVGKSRYKKPHRRQRPTIGCCIYSAMDYHNLSPPHASLLDIVESYLTAELGDQRKESVIRENYSTTCR